MFHGVVNYVQDHPVASRLSVEFTVNIVPVGLEDDFLALINQKRIGTFCGTDEGRLKLHQRITATKFEDADTALRFARGIHKALSVDERTVPSVETNIADQLTKNVTVEQVYNFIYSLKYLQPSYVLRWDGREIAVLSPGERGTLLLAFYLLIDRNDIPLIIDQPEGNLDNKTVFEVLVDCLKDAKKRRQVVIVTHNPNLAVVCDADQIVYSSIDKQSGCHMTYESGAIENAAMNKHVVDVLEGTKPAFRNRDDKYEAVTSAGGQNA